MEFSTHQEIGDRSTQQDRLCTRVLETQNGPVFLAAAFDGHSGTEAAAYAAEFLPKGLEDRFGQADTQEPLESALDAVIQQVVHDLRHEFSGTTISAALIDERHEQVAIAVLGDSSIVVFSDTKAAPFVTPQHNVCLCESDVRTIQGRIDHQPEHILDGYPSIGGGYIWADRHYGRGINLTRTAGDDAFNGLILHAPFVATQPFGLGDLLLLGSDGVRFDDEPASTPTDRVWTRCDEAATIVRQSGGAYDVALLAQLAGRAEGHHLDNITVIIVLGREAVGVSTKYSMMANTPTVLRIRECRFFQRRTIGSKHSSIRFFLADKF